MQLFVQENERYRAIWEHWLENHCKRARHALFFCTVDDDQAWQSLMSAVTYVSGPHPILIGSTSETARTADTTSTTFYPSCHGAVAMSSCHRNLSAGPCIATTPMIELSFDSAMSQQDQPFVPSPTISAPSETKIAPLFQPKEPPLQASGTANGPIAPAELYTSLQTMVAQTGSQQQSQQSQALPQLGYQVPFVFQPPR